MICCRNSGVYGGLRHRGLLERECPGVHQTGATSVVQVRRHEGRLVATMNQNLQRLGPGVKGRAAAPHSARRQINLNTVSELEAPHPNSAPSMCARAKGLCIDEDRRAAACPETKISFGGTRSAAARRQRSRRSSISRSFAATIHLELPGVRCKSRPRTARGTSGGVHPRVIRTCAAWIFQIPPERLHEAQRA